MYFDFVQGLDTVHTSDPYYDLFEGGYIDPSVMLKDKTQAQSVEEALQLLADFLEQAEEEGLLEWC